MTKTKEELNQLKTEFETLTSKLKGLTEDELKFVSGGIPYVLPKECPVGLCPYSSKSECPHINYGRDSISGCIHN